MLVCELQACYFCVRLSGTNGNHLSQKTDFTESLTGKFIDEYERFLIFVMNFFVDGANGKFDRAAAKVIGPKEM